MPEPLQAAIRSLLPPDVALSVWEGDGTPELYPEEAAAVARAVPERVAEFARGRACARAALAQLGLGPGPLLVGAERAPIWPRGFVGSITHCRGLVAAVAARSDQVTAIGLDAEPVGPLPEGTEPLILHPLERRAPDGSQDKVLFGAKESIFKALHPLTGLWLDFLDVVVELDQPTGRFRAAAAPEAKVAPPQLERLRGAWVVSSGFVLAAGWLESAARLSPAP